MSNRRKLVPFWVPLLFGLLSFSSMVGRPRFATFHATYVIQLIGTGMCFGVALATLVVFLRGARSSPPETHR